MKGGHMPKQLPIIELGDPLLLTVAKRVTNHDDPVIQELIDDLLYTCEKVDGAGIAAPQVGQSMRIFIMASKPSARYPHAPDMKPLALINPEMERKVERPRIRGWEGCLSIPGLRGVVKRYDTITVSYLTREGVLKKEIFTGFLARIFQHELDHLNGIMFVSHIHDPRDFATEHEFQKLVVAGKHLNP